MTIAICLLIMLLILQPGQKQKTKVRRITKVERRLHADRWEPELVFHTEDKWI